MANHGKGIVIEIIITILLSTLLLTCIHTKSFAKTNGLTVKQAKQIFDGYIKSKGKNYEIGTEEYTAFVMETLDCASDSEWERISETHNKEMRVFAVQYIKALERYPEQAKKGVLPDVIADKTLVDLKMLDSKGNDASAGSSLIAVDQVDAADDYKVGATIIQKFMALLLPNDNVFAAKKKYSPKKAADYAYKYGMSYSDKYPFYLGGDCTNFVSQAVIAGGKNMKSKKPKKSTEVLWNDKYWFQRKYSYKSGKKSKKIWKRSASWSMVDNFYKYWRKYRLKNKKGKTSIL